MRSVQHLNVRKLQVMTKHIHTFRQRKTYIQTGGQSDYGRVHVILRSLIIWVYEHPIHQDQYIAIAFADA